MEIKDILRISQLDSEGLAEISQAFTEQKYLPKEIVFREGDPSDAFYFIRSGRFLVSKRNQNGDDEPLGVLEEGQFFGEIGLLENMERTATVTALVDSEVFQLDAATFGSLLEKSDAFTALLNDVAQKRLIKQVSIFRELDDQGLTDVQNLLTEKLYPEKTTIFEENDPSDALYIIVKGEVRISKRTQSEKDLTLTFLGQGNHFGELGLIDPQPRSATATTAEPSKLLVLTSSDFQSLRHNPVIAFNMLKIVSRRLREIDRELTLAKGTPFFKGITIISRPEKCLACRACEIACAVSKSRTRNLFEAVYEEPPPIKRIHVRRVRDGSQPVIRPEHCLHCRDAPCLSKCKLGAIKRDPILGIIVISEEKCKGCGLCAKVCPFSVINMVRTAGWTRVALKCTQCAEHEAGPACVRACPTNALVISLATMPVA
jgi:carbon-monoxide dehydrogenase iron sulfur subunit